MVKNTVVFKSADRMEMKFTARLIDKANQFQSTIYLTRGDRRANAKSLLGVMSLGIEDGMEITVTADGPDQDEALKGLSDYLENNVEE